MLYELKRVFFSGSEYVVNCKKCLMVIDGSLYSLLPIII